MRLRLVSVCFSLPGLIIPRSKVPEDNETWSRERAGRGRMFHQLTSSHSEKSSNTCHLSSFRVQSFLRWWWCTTRPESTWNHSGMTHVDCHSRDIHRYTKSQSNLFMTKQSKQMSGRSLQSHWWVLAQCQLGLAPAPPGWVVDNGWMESVKSAVQGYKQRKWNNTEVQTCSNERPDQTRLGGAFHYANRIFQSLKCTSRRRGKRREEASGGA